MVSIKRQILILSSLLLIIMSVYEYVSYKKISYRFDFTGHYIYQIYRQSSFSLSSNLTKLPVDLQDVETLRDTMVSSDRESILRATINNPEWRKALYGVVWPRPYAEENDRMAEQLVFVDYYQTLKNLTGGITKPKVLLGMGNFNLESFREGEEIFVADGCPRGWCRATRNESDYQTADAVIISQYPWHGWFKPPKPSHQIWIAQHMESPRHNRIRVNLVRDLINWTASFRRESTVFMPYGTYKQLPADKVQKNLSELNYAQNKTKLVAMLVSNCQPSSNRMSYARELAKYIEVDIYGGCGTKRCADGLPHGSVPCVNWLSKSYKFYLSFENSNCKDYITEKFTHNALKNNILPIALGAHKPDYLALAPPHSFIHVSDYESPKHLADYLHVLNKNDTLYNEYFKWKGRWDLVQQRYWCRICTLLHLQSDVQYIHAYQNYEAWWGEVCT